MTDEFVSDGCSGGMSAAWRFFLNSPPPWEGCCVEHDRRYWAGGTAAQRREVDAQLLACVAAKGHPLWAIVMWMAVRIGGAWFWPGNRWGAGNKEPS
jgi:hypothetical protein